MEVRETVNKLTEACIELRARLDKCDKGNERDALVLNHLEKFVHTDIRIADFQAGIACVYNINMSKYKRQPTTAVQPCAQERSRNWLTEKQVNQYTDLVKYECQLDEELLQLKSQETAIPSEDDIMNLLHHYNDIRDCMSVLFRSLADSMGVSVGALYERYMVSP